MHDIDTHEAPPARPVLSSPLLNQLNDEWARLEHSSSVDVQIRRWTRRETALAGFSTLDSFLVFFRAGGRDVDPVLVALIRLFQQGHRLAGRVVLQTFLPKLVKMSVNATDGTATTVMWAEEKRQLTITEFWDVLGTYPVARRPAGVPSNLILDTLHRITKPRRIDPDCTLVRCDIEAITPTRQLDNAPEHSHVDADEITADSDLRHVLAWAADRNIISREDAQIMAVSYLQDQGYGFTQAEQQFGLTQAAIRQRCSRATKKLADAVRAEILDTNHSSTSYLVA